MFFTVNNRIMFTNTYNVDIFVDTFNSVLIKFPSRFSAWYNCDVIGVSYLNKYPKNSKTTRAKNLGISVSLPIPSVVPFYVLFSFIKKDDDINEGELNSNWIKFLYIFTINDLWWSQSIYNLIIKSDNFF